MLVSRELYPPFFNKNLLNLVYVNNCTSAHTGKHLLFEGEGGGGKYKVIFETSYAHPYRTQNNIQAKLPKTWRRRVPTLFEFNYSTLTIMHRQCEHKTYFVGYASAAVACWSNVVVQATRNLNG